MDKSNLTYWKAVEYLKQAIDLVGEDFVKKLLNIGIENILNPQNYKISLCFCRNCLSTSVYHEEEGVYHINTYFESENQEIELLDVWGSRSYCCNCKELRKIGEIEISLKIYANLEAFLLDSVPAKEYDYARLLACLILVLLDRAELWDLHTYDVIEKAEIASLIERCVKKCSESTFNTVLNVISEITGEPLRRVKQELLTSLI